MKNPQPVCRWVVTSLVICNLLYLVFGASMLNSWAGLTPANTATVDLCTQVGIVVAFGIFALKNGIGNVDKALVLAIAAFAAVVFSTVPSAIENGAGNVWTTLRQSSLAVLPVVSFAYMAPRVLNQRNYLVVFSTVLAVFSLHTLLTVWLCMTQTSVLFYHSISVGEGRSMAMFGWTLITGLFWNSNVLATSMMLLPAAAVLVDSMVSSVRAKLAARAALVLIAGHVLVTLSRAAVGTIVASFAVWGLLSKSVRRSVKLASAAVVLLLFVFGAVQLLNFKTDRPLLLRGDIWQSCVQQIALQPLGSGLPTAGTEQMPHSFVLGTAVYFGIPGLLLLMLIIGALGVKAWKRVENGSASQLVLITLMSAVILHGTVEWFICHPSLFANSFFWLLLGHLAFSPNSQQQQTDA